MKYLICICGWISEAYPTNATLFARPEGGLCPECMKVHRYYGLGGSVLIIREKTYWSIIASDDKLAAIRQIFADEQAKVELVRKILRRRKDEWQSQQMRTQ